MRTHFRLGASIAHPEDGTSFYRGMGPLGQMVRESRRMSESVNERMSEDGKGQDLAVGHDLGRPVLEVVLPERLPNGSWDLAWHWLAQCDGIFMRSPYLPVHVTFCRTVKSMGLPLWIDYDDDITCVPHSNPHWTQYADNAHGEELRKRRQELIALADFVTVSTAELGNRLARGNGTKVRIIPNACMHKFFLGETRRRIVSWRGGAGHDEDVAGVVGPIRDLSRLPQFGKWEWLFMGDAPWLARSAVPETRVTFDEGTSLQFFVALLSAYAPWVNMVPLANHGFNRCKSNNAWIEGTCAGALTVAPDWEEWRRPGVLLYEPGDRASFEAVLRGAMNEYGSEVSGRVQESAGWIRENLMLAKVNQLRWEIIDLMR